MEHVVFFPAHDGTPAFRRVASLDDAVRLVEHLRNVEGVAELSVHSLSEVPLAFKAVYRVEVPSTSSESAPEAVAEAPEPVPSVVADAPVEEAPQVPSQELPPPLPVMEVPAVEGAPPVEAPVDEEQVPALASSNGHAEDAPSSLGFFAS